MTKRLQILTKWRQVFCMLATSGAIPFERYVRDQAEAQLLHRAELSALTALLIQKGVFTQTEFAAQIDIEAEVLCEQLQKRFPGFTATETGMTLQNPQAYATMGSWHEQYGMPGFPPEAKG